MTTSATKSAFQIAKYAHDLLEKAVSDFPADKLTFQTSPTDNHILWHLGHLAMDYKWFASAIDGKPGDIAEAESKLFGMGSKPVADPKAYPPIAELRKRFDAAWQRFAAAAESLREEDALKPPQIETGGFLKDRLDTVNKTAWHDGWHTGQISGLRKALGLKGLFS